MTSEDSDTAAAATAPRARALPSLAARALPWLIVAAALAVYTTISLRQWAAYDFPSWDLGIFSEAAQSYSRGGAPIVSIKGDRYNLLGDHFHPILALTGPLWALWPSPLMLLVLQAALFAISAVALTRLSIDRLGMRLGALFGLGYVFSWGIQAAHVVQFHEIAFAVPMLAFSLTALIRERYLTAAIWAALLVTVKEDLGLTVLMVGAVMIWRGWRSGAGRSNRVRSDRWRSGAGRGNRWRSGAGRGIREGRSADARTIMIGAALTVWGAVWAVLSMLVILPALSPAGQFEYTSHVGSLLDAFMPGTKWLTVLLLILAMGVVGLRSPIWLIMLPTLAWRFTGTVEFYWGWTWHYSAVLMPVAAAALLDALGHGRARRRFTAPIAVTALLGSSLCAHLLGPALPVAEFTSPLTAQQRAHRLSTDAVLAELPAGEPLVAADISVMAPAVPSADVQWIHGPNTLTPTCAIVDLDAFSWGGQPPTDRAVWLRERYQVRFELITQRGAVELWCLERQLTRTG